MLEYLKSKKILFEDKGDSIFKIRDETFYFLKERERLFDSNFDFKLTEEEKELQCDYFAFKLGSRYYYSPKEKPELKQIVYLGKPNEPNGIIDYNLGIHGKYELLNGSRTYGDWCKKANWLGVKSLGLVEKQTLAGVVQFQESCKENDIKPIFGTSILVKYGEKKVYVKAYAKDQNGWQSLLSLNKIQNVDRAEDGRFCKVDELIKNKNGLYFILDYSLDLDQFKELFKDSYFQIDFAELENESRDLEKLKATENYLKKYKNKIPPVFINESYYLEPEDSEVKVFLNQINKADLDYRSSDQWFKDENELFSQVYETDFPDDVLSDSITNAKLLVENCNFSLDTKKRNLPKYEMIPEESDLFISNDELFWAKVELGLEKKVISQGKDLSVYLKRVEEEVDVLERGNIKDYFLILSDVSRWCDRNGVLRGTGRGSAAGSLISYLFDIVEADPIEYNLLFSRFLNEARLGKQVNEYKLKEKVLEADNYFEVETEDGEVMKIHPESSFFVERGTETIEVRVNELKNGDKILKS